VCGHAESTVTVDPLDEPALLESGDELLGE
jgi:hypothetical protein